MCQRLNPHTNSQTFHLPVPEEEDQCQYDCCHVYHSRRCCNHHSREHRRPHVLGEPTTISQTPQHSIFFPEIGGSPEHPISGLEEIPLMQFENAPNMDDISLLLDPALSNEPEAKTGTESTHEHNARKGNRKSQQENGFSAPETPKQTQRESRSEPRRTHYRIERRYRAGINDKMKALEKILPEVEANSEVVESSNNGKEAGGNSNDNLGGSKRSKGAVLADAVDHIASLRQQISSLQEEVQGLKTRMRSARESLGE